MSSTTPSRLQGLHIRQERIVAAWYDAIGHTSSFSLDAPALRRQLTALTERVIGSLLAGPFVPDEARAIGADLARLGYIRPEDLARSLEALSQHLAADVAAGDLAALHPRLTALLAQITAGFVRQDRATVRADQEFIHRALQAARREAEDARRVSEERYRAVVTQAAEGIVLSDAVTTRILETNPAFQQLLGYTAAELVGMPLRTLIAHPEPSIDWNIRQALTRGRHDVAERRCRRKDGSLVTVEARIARLRSSQGPLLCAVVCDVTERAQIAAELEETRARLAESREHERLRLARELHDGAVQELVGLRYQLAAATRWLDERQQSADLAGVLERSEQQIVGLVGQLRGLIAELRPTGLDESGLAAALENYVADLFQTAEDEVAITLDVVARDDHLSRAASLCLFRVAQEAVRNALLHAQARRVIVRVRSRPTRVILRVCDDGRGFVVPDRLTTLARARHFGLLGMAERVGSAGGRLRIRSRPGLGTVVTVWLPLAQGNEPRERSE